MLGLKVLMLVATYYECVKESTLTGAMGDIGVGIMAWLNIIAILIIAKPALICLKDYEQQLKLGIKNAHSWEERNKEKVE